MMDHSWDDCAVQTVHFSTSDLVLVVDPILDLEDSMYTRLSSIPVIYVIIVVTELCACLLGLTVTSHFSGPLIPTTQSCAVQI